MFAIATALSAACGLSYAEAECPGNQLQDPGFEAGDLREAWGEMTSGPLSEMLAEAGESEWPVASGNYALRFYGRFTDDVLSVGQLVPFASHTAYELSFDLYLTAPELNGAVAISLDGEWQAYANLDELPFTGGYQRIQFPIQTDEVDGPAILAIENPFLDGGDILLDNFCLKALEDEPVVINAVHVQLTINAALGLAITDDFDPDINGDGVVNAVDVQLIINAALGIPLAD